VQVSYRFWNFESSSYIVVRFALSKVRCGRTVHSDRDTGSFGFRHIGLTRWINSDRRQVERVIRVFGGRPLTDVIPSVQPDGRDGEKLDPR